MSSLNKKDYLIVQLSKEVAKQLSIKHHYLHSSPAAIRYAYGLVNINSNNLEGFIIYSIPHSTLLREAIAGKTYKNDVIELSRLWVSDSVPKNGESFLIGNTLKLIKETRYKFVVSFADSKKGHTGIVYRASNWLYTGLTPIRKTKIPRNAKGHPLSMTYGKTVSDLKMEYGELAEVPTGGLHRYIYITGNKELISKIRLKLESYPTTHVL